MTRTKNVTLGFLYSLHRPVERMRRASYARVARLRHGIVNNAMGEGARSRDSKHHVSQLLARHDSIAISQNAEHRDAQARTVAGQTKSFSPTFTDCDY